MRETYSQHHTQWAKTKSFPPRSRTRQGCLLSLRLFNIVLGVLATAIGPEEEIKGIQIRKEEMKLSLFADDMIVYMENPLDSTQKLLDLINEFGKIAGYRVNTQKSKTFLYTKNEMSKTEIRKKNPICYSNKKNKVPRNKPNQGGKKLVLRKLHNTEETN